VAAGGKFPDQGFTSETFHPKSLRFTWRGKPIAGGWRQGKGKVYVGINWFDVQKYF